jgi:hypothetical protein
MAQSPRKACTGAFVGELPLCDQRTEGSCRTKKFKGAAPDLMAWNRAPGSKAELRVGRARPALDAVVFGRTWIRLQQSRYGEADKVTKHTG